ncbi:MAG: D-aminoacyl-tRNA deacylase [Solirubrobacteraceae bacterium]
MRAIIQRVSEASVIVNNKVVGEISLGLLVLVGFEEADVTKDYSWMIRKIINLRIFNDAKGKMNLSVNDIFGELLIVSQFTLYADIKRGNRPSYSNASKPELAINQYSNFLELLKAEFNKKIQMGVFGADMELAIINNGPVTIFLDSTIASYK